MKSQTEPPLYCFFTELDDDTLLGHLFNQVIEALKSARIVSSPETTTVDGWNNREKAFLFYEMCLTEQYLHSIISNLSKWEKLTRKYAKEFHYSWKYYALANRMDLIKEVGGEDDDYNDDGSVRTDFRDEELIDDTIIAELLDTSCNNIFISTKPTDCLKVCYMIIHAGTFCIIDLFKEKTGKKIKTYRMGEYGEMIQNDWTDEAMQKAEKQLEHENIADIFWSVILFVNELIRYVEKLPKTEDNREFFQKLPKVIDNIFYLKIPLIKLPEIEIFENATL
jgi:oligoribonuclease (3'-5' exoribonuclease)